jgi:FAD/FMN-containing dehydrogenase
VVRVTSTHEVSEVVSFASKRHIPFVVKAGGHSTSGSSATHGGIVISLSKMRKVVVDPASKTVAVQGGATWEDIDEAAAQHGLAVVGGTVNHTGVGRTTLGGGYGWLMGRYGLIIDNLLSVKMVLADGFVNNILTSVQ